METLETAETTAPDLLGSATYEMESNKLRLYVGRVDRPTFDRLRAEGWQVTPKQECDFAAVWTPQRRKTALELCGEIEDEDTPPAERALQRAERFAGYREKRMGEAVAGADRFDAGPVAFGFQDRGRAERAAARLDRVAGRAVDAWSKAEYWQRRTAGVIANALHLAEPGVRMGRIKELEADERRFMAENRHEEEGGWLFHTRQRLAYERAMLEAEGGRAGALEIVPGGWVSVHVGPLRGSCEWFQIRKVNRSNVTGRVVSVQVWQRGSRYDRSAPGRHLANVEIERASPDRYRAPTPEELAGFEAALKLEKADKKATAPAKPPLINPTPEDAARLQAIWNEKARADAERRGALSQWKAVPVMEISQAFYSERSKGSFSALSTVELVAGGEVSRPSYSMRKEIPRAVVCDVRRCSTSGFYDAARVVRITDKPAKPFPVSLWETVAVQPVTTEQPAVAMV